MVNLLRRCVNLTPAMIVNGNRFPQGVPARPRLSGTKHEHYGEIWLQTPASYPEFHKRVRFDLSLSTIVAVTHLALARASD